MVKWVGLVVGGTVGTVARYLLTGTIYGIFGSTFPYGTLFVNILGCFIIGFLAAITEEKFLLGPNARLLLMVGFCGAFTTFSTFMFETVNLMKDGEMMRAFVNVLASVMIGFLCLRVGFVLGELI